ERGRRGSRRGGEYARVADEGVDAAHRLERAEGRTERDHVGDGGSEGRLARRLRLALAGGGEIEAGGPRRLGGRPRPRAEAPARQAGRQGEGLLAADDDPVPPPPAPLEPGRAR